MLRFSYAIYISAEESAISERKPEASKERKQTDQWLQLLHLEDGADCYLSIGLELLLRPCPLQEKRKI